MDGSSNLQDNRVNDAREADSSTLRFLNFSHPSQVKGRNSKKTVRSRVTRVQHERARIRKFVKTGNAVTGYVPAALDYTEGFRSELRPAAAPKYSNSIAVVPPSESSYHTGSVSKEDNNENEVEEVPRYGVPKQVAVSKVNPFAVYDPGSDWTVDVPSIIDQYVNKARLHMMSQGMAKEARALHSRLIQPRLYMDGFLFNALITLTTTNVPVLNEERRSDAVVAWLRRNFLITIQAAMKAGSYDPRALAIGIAMLVGWELEIGDPNLCQVHLKALPSIMESESDRSSRDAGFTYRDQGIEGVFRGGRTIPPGFEFYRSQDLLPPTLMFIVGSLMYWGSHAPGASLWMRELWSSIGACAPVEINAQKSLSHRTVASRIAQLVRQAGIMLGSFMRLSAGEQPVAQPLLTGLHALWHSTLSDDWDSLIGTVYDEILLWCLCVFCTTSGYRNEHHLTAIRRLMAQLKIQELESLSALLATFVWPSYFHRPLEDLCKHTSELFPSIQSRK